MVIEFRLNKLISAASYCLGQNKTCRCQEGSKNVSEISLVAQRVAIIGNVYATGGRITCSKYEITSSLSSWSRLERVPCVRADIYGLKSINFQIHRKKIIAEKLSLSSQLWNYQAAGIVCIFCHGRRQGVTKSKEISRVFMFTDRSSDL